MSWPFETSVLPSTARDKEQLHKQQHFLWFQHKSEFHCLRFDWMDQWGKISPMIVNRPDESVLFLSIWWWSSCSWIQFWPPVISANRWTSGWVLVHWQIKTEHLISFSVKNIDLICESSHISIQSYKVNLSKPVQNISKTFDSKIKKKDIRKLYVLRKQQINEW